MAKKAKKGNGKEEIRDIRAKLNDIDDSIDRLLDNLTSINKEFVDKKLAKLGSEKKTLEKELVRAFVEKLVLDPDTGKGKPYIRQFPASIAKTGNASFNMVAGARY